MLMEIWQIVIHFRDRYHQLYDDNGNSRYIFCQFTNLFDKDGEEIFEGSIIDYDDDSAMLGIVVNVDGQWQLKDKNGNLMFLKGAPHQKVVGHILSNPELLNGRTLITLILHMAVNYQSGLKKVTRNGRKVERSFSSYHQELILAGGTTTV